MVQWNDEEILALEDLAGDIAYSKLVAILKLDPEFDEVRAAFEMARRGEAPADFSLLSGKICHILAILTAPAATDLTIH